MAAGLLPSGLRSPAAHDLEDTAGGHLVCLARQKTDNGRDVIGLFTAMVVSESGWRRLSAVAHLERIHHFLRPGDEMSTNKVGMFDQCKNHQMVMVMAVPADGAMALARMLYLRPSWARARVKPMIAALAAEYLSENKY